MPDKSLDLTPGRPNLAVDSIMASCLGYHDAVAQLNSIDIKDIIMDYDNELIDRHVLKFPMTYKRRWYDKDPYSWLIINALKYANEDLITDVILYLKGKL